MADSIELTTFKGLRVTLFKKWITAVRELPAHHPVPYVACTILLGSSGEEINFRESYDEVISLLIDCDSRPVEPTGVSLVR